VVVVVVVVVQEVRVVARQGVVIVGRGVAVGEGVGERC
jgi:hypothetical protein